MADKFELSTKQWVPTEPNITLPQREILDAGAWGELNNAARELRGSMLGGRGINGLISDASGEPTRVARIDQPISAPEQPTPPLPPAV